MSALRGLYSSKTKIRNQIFTEVARFAYEGGDYSKFENLPYEIIPGEISTYRESIFLERAIVGERLRLAMGLPLLPVSKQAPISTGVEESMIDEKVYDPPLINIIKFACHKCAEKRVVVRAVLNTRAQRFARREQSRLYTENRILTMKSASNAENVRVRVRTMQS